jgi:hypothetical protein
MNSHYILRHAGGLMAFVPDLESIRLGSPYDDDLPLAKDQRTSIYGNRLRSFAFPTNFAVQDPDPALEQDADFYDKVYKELGIMAPLRKRASRAASTGWSVQHDSPKSKIAADIFNEGLKKIRNFNRARRNLLIQSILKGWGIARIFGQYKQIHMPGDDRTRRWWVPTKLVDIGKERMRINENSEFEVQEGMSRYYWAIQDIITQRWHPLDFDGAPPGLRRIDYIWARSGDAEDDLGYSHGIARLIPSKWYMLTFLWLYGLDGAESWSKGKIVVQSPHVQGGATLPGDLKGLRASQAIKDLLANAVARQVSRNVLVLDENEKFTVHGQPTSGHEAVQWLIKELKAEFAELILGINPEHKAKDQPDIDPNIVTEDASNLEDAMEDLKWAFVKWNRHNFAAMGIETKVFEEVRYQLKRDQNMTPEQLGKTFMVAAALGAPIHRDDVYRGLGLTKVDANDPEAIHLPPPGSPVSASGSVVADTPATPVTENLPSVESVGIGA